MGSFLRNASIGLKVSLAPAFAVLCLLVVAAVSWAANRSLTHDMQSVGGPGLRTLNNAHALARELTVIHQEIYQSLTWEAVGQRAEQIQQLDASLVKRLSTFDARVKAAAAAPDLEPEQRNTMAEFAKGWGGYSKVAADTLDLKTGGVASAATYIVSLDKQFTGNLALLDKSVQTAMQTTDAQVAQAQVSAQRNSLLVAAITAVAVVLAAGLSWTFMRAISRPLQEAAELAHHLAQGDLTYSVGASSTDATGRMLTALGGVSRNLTTMVADIRSTADEIDTASGEIASGNSDLSSRTESTASSLQETAASIEELTATVRQSADNAQAANALARDASNVAREGGALVQGVVQTMDQINSQAKKIGEIIGTIDGIAFQTNILALNAAVEAARAGEQGRGFSVVASEVRLLAQRSAESAREIRTLIGSSVEQIDAGVNKVQAAGHTMTKIVGAIEKVAGTVDGIARASSEQAAGIAQVNNAVSEMERATQQNAAMVEEATAATESLRHQSQRLVGLLGRFRTS